MSKKLSYFLMLTTSFGLLASCSSDAEFASSGAKSYDQVANNVYSFRSSKIVPAALTISDGGRFTSLDVTQAERAPSQVIQRQIKRQSYSEAFVQGHAARYSEEEFQLSEAGMLDFLVVVDNSRSMNNERDMVGRGLAPLISAFKDTNWQIAVVSMSNPCIGSSNLIKKSDINASQKFADAVQKSVDWQATEQGFPMAIRALRGQCNGATRPWLREDSTVGILFVSDEDNCGSDSGEQARCANIEGKNADEMVKALRGIRPAELGRMYAIVDKDGTCPNAGGTGQMYVQALQMTGGTAGSICHDYNSSSGYGDYLGRVSTDVSRIIKRQFKLSSTPDMGQFNVYVDGKVATSGVIEIKGNVVVIDPASFKDGLKIKFGYTHDAVPMFSEVPLRISPSVETIKVTINGVAQTPDADYFFDVATRTLKFKSMPKEDAKIFVSYLEDRKLLTHFPANLTGVRPDTLNVVVNGVQAKPNDFAFDNDGVDFALAPADGAVLTISWKTEEHKITSYVAKISDPRQPVAWQVSDKSSGEKIAAQWDGSWLKFTPDQVVEGRVVVFTVDFGEKSQTRAVTLPDDRMDDDVTILADGKEGVCSAASPEDSEQVAKLEENKDESAEAKKEVEWKKRYKGRNLYLKCQEGVDYSELKISYKHEIERTGTFEVKLPADLDPNDSMLGWQVFIDGVKSQDFERNGRVITMDADKLPPETRVDVEVVMYSLARN